MGVLTTLYAVPAPLMKKIREDNERLAFLFGQTVAAERADGFQRGVQVFLIRIMFQLQDFHLSSKLGEAFAERRAGCRGPLEFGPH